MSKGKSLHIGINEVDPKHYAGWSGPLSACEADSEDLLALAISHDYEAKLLSTSDATREAVVRTIKGIAEELDAGDIFFLSYSGHGGQIPDRNGDETDLSDETWCLYDGQLIDDELRLLWSNFKPRTRVLVLSDSCHSGSAARWGIGVARSPDGFQAEQLGIQGARYRCMPVQACAKAYRINRSFYDEIQQNIPQELPPVETTVRLISGCQDNQLSLDGVFNGLFTGQLLRVWSSGRFQGNYAEFHRAIVANMPPTQTPNHLVFGATNLEFDNQTPFAVS